MTVEVEGSGWQPTLAAGWVNAQFPSWDFTDLGRILGWQTHCFGFALLCSMIEAAKREETNRGNADNWAQFMGNQDVRSKEGAHTSRQFFALPAEPSSIQQGGSCCSRRCSSSLPGTSPTLLRSEQTQRCGMVYGVPADLL